MKKLTIFRCIFYPIVLITILSGYQDSRFINKYSDVHPELKYYVDKFVKFSDGVLDAEDLDGLTMGFADLPKDNKKRTLGRCFLLLNEVEISRNFWNTASEGQRMYLVFHELGHCTCFIMHKNEELEDGCPSHLMHEEFPEERCIFNHWDRYVSELYKDC